MISMWIFTNRSIIYSAFVKYLIKNENIMRQCTSYLYI
jgi:hypothetical protein